MTEYLQKIPKKAFAFAGSSSCLPYLPRRGVSGLPRLAAPGREIEYFAGWTFAVIGSDAEIK